VVSYTIVDTYTPTALATFSHQYTRPLPASVTAVDRQHLPSGGNAAASFITTTADGIQSSRAGNGANGGCTTILLRLV